MTSAELKPIMTRVEAASYLRIGISKLDEMIQRGTISVKRDGRRVLVLGRSLERFTTEG